MKVEERKVYRSGKSSYIITLPKKWVKDYGIKEGDSLTVEIKGDSITLKPKKEEKKLEAFIDEREASFQQLLRLVISYYLAGFSSIRVKVYSDEQRRAIAYVTDLLIGAEVLEDTGDLVTIEVFLDVNRFDVDIIIDKLSNIVTSMLKDFQKVIKNLERPICSSIMSREDEVDKLHFLALRLLNFHGTMGTISPVDAMDYRSIIRSIERISDHISQMSEATLNINDPYPELAEDAEKVEKLLRRAIVAFFKKDRALAEDILDEVEEFSNAMLRHYENFLRLDVVSIMNLKSIVDSLVRIASYSANIAESVLNLSVRNRYIQN